MKVRTRALILAAGLGLGLLSATGVPLRYDHGNSGRYLLQVLRAADADLFPNDPVVDSLQRFRSLFYDVLSGVVRRAAIRPDELPALFFWLYGLSRIGIVLAVMAFARAFDSDPLVAVYLGVWSCFTKSAPVGGDSLFVNVVTHGTVSFLLGAAALWTLFTGRRLGFWGLLSANLFVHPLMTLHLALCLVPAHFFRRRRIDRIDVLGGVVFLTSLAVCSAAIPPLSAEEAGILVAVKGRINHVALSAQGLTDWLRQITVLIVALGAWRLTRRPSPSGDRDLLAAAILCGTLAAGSLSLLATGTHSARLVQLQPLRIFVWVQLLCFALIASLAVRAWRDRSAAAPALTAFFVLSLVPTLWQYLFAPIALAGLAVPKRSRLWRAATWGVVALICAGWCARDVRPALETLRSPMVPLLVLLVAAAWIAAGAAGDRFRGGIAVLLAAAACAGSAVSWHRYYDEQAYPEWGSTFKDRVHTDWHAVRRWISLHTPKDARVLVAGGRGNFRTLGLRVGLGESMSALAWVDPHAYERVAVLAARVADCRSDRGWQLDRLTALATTERAGYLLVEGEVSTAVRPLFEVGAFRVYKTAGVAPGGTG